MSFVTPAVMVKSELRGDLWQRCHLIGAFVGARRATFSYEGHGWSQSCLLLDVLGGRLFGIGSHWLQCRSRRGSRWRSSKVKSESLARGGVTTMTLDDILIDGFSSRWRVCSVWVARLAGVSSVCCWFSPDFLLKIGHFLLN